MLLPSLLLTAFSTPFSRFVPSDIKVLYENSSFKPLAAFSFAGLCITSVVYFTASAKDKKVQVITQEHTLATLPFKA